jgi:predicted phage terminase large subunit-like protein
MTEPVNADFDPASIAADREYVKRFGFAGFVRRAWHKVEGTALVFEPHMQLLCDHYEAVSRGEITRLVVNVPPGMSKTIITTVLWNAWDWRPVKDGGSPWKKYMAISYDQSNAWNEARRVRELVQSDWYQQRWGVPQGGATITKESAGSKQDFYNTLGGRRFSTMMGGVATGVHAHIQLCDDPNKAQDLEGGGDAARKKFEDRCNQWSTTFSSRHADAATFARVVIAQRLHESDLPGQCIREGYQALVLPMEFEPETAYRSKWGDDWRTTEGELLAPKRFPQSVIDTKKKEMSAIDYAAQMQQRPTPAEGAIFKLHYFSQRYEYAPQRFDRLTISVDCNYKEKKKSDFFVAQVWGKVGSRMYFLDQYKERGVSIAAGARGVLGLRKKWLARATACEVIIEDKANGQAVYQALRDVIPGVMTVDPLGGKQARASAVEMYFEAMDCFFPSDALCPWIKEYILAMCSFPFGRFDDEVDATTQAVARMAGKGSGRKIKDVAAGVRRRFGVA